jgi:quinoprotein dehydrogenase-associated probable ABC transporter substrate-binding protein
MLTRFVLPFAVFCIAVPAMAADLKVCADPNNLPFSNKQQQGFENKIAQVIATDLGRTISYTWWAQRRGYVRNTLKAEDCDLWIGVATDVDMVMPTASYYRSSYVLVSRADRNIRVRSFDDPALHHLKIGVQLIGDDGDNPPPAHALAKRGIVDNVRGYMIYGDYNTPNPPARIIEAVDGGDIEIAAVWGPLAGYFASRARHAMKITPVEGAEDETAPMQFDISVGVRKGDLGFKHTIDRILMHRRAQIDAILADYHVPVIEPPTAPGCTHAGKAYVSNQNGEVVEIDLNTLKPIEELDIGGKAPRGIGITRNGGFLLTANKDTNDASLIDTASGAVKERIPLGISPEFVRLRGDTAFVTYEPEDKAKPGDPPRKAQIAFVDLKRGTVSRTVPSGVETEGLALSADGKYLIATNEGDETLSVIDALTGREIKKIDTRAFGSRPRGIARLRDGSGYAVTFESSSHLITFNNAFEPIKKVQTKLGPYGVTEDPSGKLLVVAAARANTLQVFDAGDLSLLHEVPIGRRCWHFTYSPDGRYILLACGRSNEVQVIDAHNYQHVTSIKGLDMPWGIVTYPKSYGSLDEPEAAAGIQNSRR